MAPINRQATRATRRQQRIRLNWLVIHSAGGRRREREIGDNFARVVERGRRIPRFDACCWR